MDDVEKLLLTGEFPAEVPGSTEQSADEMFRALGYLWETTPRGGRGYEDEDGNEITVTKFGATFKPSGANEALRIGKDYILTCAQLIRELEVERGKH